MSRVHDALRRAGNDPEPAPLIANGAVTAAAPPAAANDIFFDGPPAPAAAPATGPLTDFLARIEEIPYTPSRDALLIDPAKPYEAPTEEFRTLRTRLNHLQSLQPIHSVVISSASPTEGKSFSAVNLSLAQAQLAGNMTLLADFDLRRPVIHDLFQCERQPGVTEYLLGKAPLHRCIRRIRGTNLCIMPAGEAVINPLELLNLREVKQLLDELPSVFNWVVLDSPPLLFAADANLLATLCHGSILVVRVGSTSVDSVTRAMQSLCQNNVLGIIVNGARRGELYSKYSYYNTYYAHPDAEGKHARHNAEEVPESENSD